MQKHNFYIFKAYRRWHYDTYIAGTEADPAKKADE